MNGMLLTMNRSTTPSHPFLYRNWQISVYICALESLGYQGEYNRIWVSVRVFEPNSVWMPANIPTPPI